MEDGIVTAAVESGGLRYFLRCLILLRIRRSCAYLATSFASATTGHAFSSGVSGKYPEPNKNRRDALGVNENTDSTRKSVIISRSVRSRTSAEDCLIVCARRLTKPLEKCRSTAKA